MSLPLACLSWRILFWLGAETEVDEGVGVGVCICADEEEAVTDTVGVVEAVVGG